MDWDTICTKVKELKSEFDKSYKSLSQNRAIQPSTINKHTIYLVNVYNEIRELFLENQSRSSELHWTQAKDVVKRLREQLVSLKERHTLDLHLPNVIDSPATFIAIEENDTKSISPRPKSPNTGYIAIVSGSDSQETANHNSPATSAAASNQLGLKSLTEPKMADSSAADRAYMKEISSTVPEFDGKKIHLQRFVTALKLVNLTKGPYEHIAVEVIKAKITGSTLYKVQNETTISAIISKLQATIVGESSDVIKAKLASIHQKGKTATQFTTEIDNLRKLLEAAYIDEGLGAEHADLFSTKEAISTMTRNCEHGRLRTILEAGSFKSMNEAIGKYIHCSTEMTGNASSVLYAQRGHAPRGNNFRGNYRGRGNNSNGYGYNNNNYNSYSNQYNNNNRGRGGFRGSNRGNGGSYNNNQRNDNNGSSNRQGHNVRVAQDNSGNSQHPLDTEN